MSAVLPKDMAAEFSNHLLFAKLIERGIVKTVKSAKKIVDRKDPVFGIFLKTY
jgi:DNA-directed RNA polymerase beta' subunit